jgi:hypothetical protein
LSEAEEFFQYCLKKFEQERVGVAQVIDEDSELTDAIDAIDGDDEEEGNKKLNVQPSKNKKQQPEKKLPVEKCEQDDNDKESKSSEESDDDDDENIRMAKLSVK